MKPLPGPRQRAESIVDRFFFRFPGVHCDPLDRDALIDEVVIPHGALHLWLCLELFEPLSLHLAESRLLFPVSLL